jgi:hypothetical protein
MSHFKQVRARSWTQPCDEYHGDYDMANRNNGGRRSKGKNRGFKHSSILNEVIKNEMQEILAEEKKKIKRKAKVNK